MNLLRKEAVRLAVFIEMFRLPADKRSYLIESALAEAELENVSQAAANFYLRRYLEYKFRYVLNSYLERLISEAFNETVVIEGRPPRLLRCFCCGYKTLQSRAEYDICPVCWWEDSGVRDAAGRSGRRRSADRSRTDQGVVRASGIRRSAQCQHL